ncbi:MULTISPECIES: nucleotidyltransferase domain-containing protein [Kribbella]|uniref:Polymerase nucleotidyl transferase domain-containing protein n=1 Tax=Kribbella karoonensis TaxID=324851 RepID=A0ABP4PDH8_9ACTN
MTHPLVDLRTRWLDATTTVLQADSAVVGAALVGSLGAGTADEWSDVDLLVVAEDPDAVALPSAGRTFAIDARHNGPAGTRATSAQYVVDGLPLWVDWHVHPLSLASWPSDSTILFEHHPIRRTPATFATYLNEGPREPATPKTPAEQHAMRIALIPIAAKQVARRSPDAPHTIQFLGGPPTTTPHTQLAALHQLLDDLTTPENHPSLTAARTYLTLLDN